MEMGCVWMRRMYSGGAISALPVKASYSIPSSSLLPFLRHMSPVGFSLPSRLPLSTAACSSSAAVVPDDEDSSPLSSSFSSSRYGSYESSRISIKKSKVLLKEMRYPELEKWVELQGFRPGQAMMLWKRLYGNNIWAHCADELEGLNKDFKRMLSEHAEFKALSLKDIRTAADGTRKILFSLGDGLVIETVIIPCDRGRNTVCVSSQVGCAMNCQFCYTGRMGLTRHLTAAEIVEQAVFARRLFSHEVGSISNVVFMVCVLILNA